VTVVQLGVGGRGHRSWAGRGARRPRSVPNDYQNLDHLAECVLAFQDRYNHAAQPFDWTHTRDDLNAFLRRLDNDAA
uniref:hypothetical protein n=1 Tax=Lapillicoccus sp. TaxID=1909287 RepID=UPI0039831397